MDLVLAKLDKARTALAEAKTIQETKVILDMAAAAEIYAKRQKMSEENVLYATSIKIEALRQLGNMLKENIRKKGETDKTIMSQSGTLLPKLTELDGNRKEPSNKEPTLADLSNFYPYQKERGKINSNT